MGFNANYSYFKSSTIGLYLRKRKRWGLGSLDARLSRNMICVDKLPDRRKKVLDGQERKECPRSKTNHGIKSAIFRLVNYTDPHSGGWRNNSSPLDTPLTKNSLPRPPTDQISLQDTPLNLHKYKLVIY